MRVYPKGVSKGWAQHCKAEVRKKQLDAARVENKAITSKSAVSYLELHRTQL